MTKLWDFRCTAERIDTGKYRVCVTGTQTGEVRVRIGFHPMWELIRLLANTPLSQDFSDSGEAPSLSLEEQTT